MSDGYTPNSQRTTNAAVSAIAVETSTSVDIVKALYEEELAALIEQARVKQFVGVIATRRVKQFLRSLKREQATNDGSTH